MRAAVPADGGLQLSVEKRQMPHGGRLALGVRHDPVPAVEFDRLVVRVTNLAANVHAGVPPHHAPGQPLLGRVLGNQSPIGPTR